MPRRTQTQHHYPLILRTYGRILKEQKTSKKTGKKISKKTKQINLETAERLFEACLRSIGPGAMLGIAATWFDPHAYGKVIGDLYKLIEERPRDPRKVSS